MPTLYKRNHKSKPIKNNGTSIVAPFFSGKTKPIMKKLKNNTDRDL